MAHLALETAAVALAKGHTLPFPDPVAEAIRVAKASAQNFSSMVTDIRRKNGTEAEAIYGAIVQAGKDCGIPTPYNAKALEWVKMLESGKIDPNPNHKAAFLFPPIPSE
jgi:2-dehydropantoate 2-reductase